jgi:hypothetical protein
MRNIRRQILAVGLILAVAFGVEIVVQKRAQILSSPLGICLLVVVVGFTLFLLRMFMFMRRHRAHVRAITDRLRPLSNDQLIEIMRTPTHRDSQFALVELMKRGVDARPTKEQLFGMLTSGNPNLCGTAMTNLGMFYPEFSLPEGSSNLDPPEVWRTRIEAFQDGNRQE